MHDCMHGIAPVANAQEPVASGLRHVRVAIGVNAKRWLPHDERAVARRGVHPYCGSADLALRCAQVVKRWGMHETQDVSLPFMCKT